jgi:YD repeat-containing protein
MLFPSFLPAQQPTATGTGEKPFGSFEGVSGNRPALSRFWGLLAAMLVLCAATGAAQQQITAPALQLNAPSDTIASPVPGVGHDYIKMLAETVNPENGAVNLNISIPTPPGRQLNFPFSIQYNSNQALFLTPSFQNLNFGLQWFNGIGEFDQGAWSYSVPTLSRKPYVFNVTWETLPGFIPPDLSTKCGVMDSYVFTAPDGSQHSLGLAHIYDNVNTGYNNSGGDYACAQVPWLESDSASDGVYQGVLASVPPNLSGNGGIAAPPSDGGTPSVTGPDGTTYVWQNGLDPACTETSWYCFGNPPTLIEDRNGNEINLQVTTAPFPPPQGDFIYLYSLNVTDTAGRPVITAPSFGQNGSTISVYGDPAPYTLKWENFTYSGYSLNVQSNSILPGDCPTPNPISTGTQTENVISSIELPNGQSYSFSYDPTYGTISKIVYPSGGYVRYVYGMDPLSSNINFNGYAEGASAPIPGACSFRTDAVAVTDRYVSFNGTTEVQHQHFTYGTTTWGSGPGALWTTKSTSVTTTDSVAGSSYVTNYQYVGQPTSSGVNFPNTFAASVEQSISIAQGSATLKTVNKGWGDQYHLDCEVDTVGNVGSAAKYYLYAAGDQIADIKEYDYGQGNPNLCQSAPYALNAILTAPAGASRETSVTYQAFPTAPYLYDRPSQIVKKDGSGNVYAETDYLYDASTVLGTPGSATTSQVSNLPPNTHDELGYGPSSTRSRGNATEVIEKCLQNCPNSITTLKYDETGQITSITDPCGNGNCGDVTGSTQSGYTSLYSYQDSPSGGDVYGNSNAYLTHITYPPTAGGVTLQKSFTYNYSTGELASSTDENSQVTNYYYYDPLLRPTQVNYPDGGETTYIYNDLALTVTTSELMNNSGTWRTTVAVLDGMRHTIQTQLTSDPDGTDFVDTSYNGMGLVYSQSNFHRSSPASTDGTSYSYYDALGRKVAQINPDGSALTSCYNDIKAPMPSGYSQTCNGQLGSSQTGTWADSTDELENDWQRTSDSFGNLRKVMEPNGATNLSQSNWMETDYCYDVLNNLTYVMQSGGSAGSFSCATPTSSAPSGARTRNFAYDSLSRLLSAANPETGTIGYSYDADGDVQSKTDARGVTTSYTYDSIKRLLSKSYTNDLSHTPNSCYQYDISFANSSDQYPLGRLTAEWTQPYSAACTTTALKAVPSNALTATVITLHDAMGRVADPTRSGNIVEYQYTPASIAKGTSYPMSFSYDLAGDLISSTAGAAPPSMTFSTPSAPCPSAPALSTTTFMFVNCYDGAGRLSSVTTNSGTGPTSLFTSQGYAPFGGLTNAAYGTTASGSNAVTLTRTYDNRLRITSETDQGNSPGTNTNGTATVTIVGAEQN